MSFLRSKICGIHNLNLLKLTRPLHLLLAALTYFFGASLGDYLVRRTAALLRPGTMHDDSKNHFCMGLGRKNLPQAVERFEAFIKGQS
jgi:hypothetical protein